MKNIAGRFGYFLGGIVLIAIGVVIIVVGFKAQERYDNDGDSKIITAGFVVVLLGGGAIAVAFSKKKATDSPKDEHLPPPPPSSPQS